MLNPLMNKAEEKNYVIFSPMEGVLMNNGKPLVNVKITRELSWNANEKGIIESFYTDQNGQFSLPLHEVSYEMSELTQFVANQRISVEYNDQEDDIWGCGKLSEYLFDETGYQLKSLVCDLSNEFARVDKQSNGILVTKCRWNNIKLVNYDE